MAQPVGAEKPAAGKPAAGKPAAGKPAAEPIVDFHGDIFDPDCPTRVVLDRIGDKWTVLVISSLAVSTLRFSQLRTQIGGVAPKVLTQTLRALERDGIVVRTVFAEVPPRVEYSLTEYGCPLAQVLDAMKAWGQSYRDRVEERAEAA